MGNNFKKDLEENVKVPEQDFDKAMEEAKAKFEQEILDANKDNTSPIIDLKLSKEQEVELRKEIAKALKGKLDKVESIDEQEKDKEDLPDLSEQDKDSKELDDGDELIVEVKEDKNKDKKDEKEQDKEDSSVAKGYLDKLEELHNLKMKMYREQVEKHEINPNEDLFYKVIFMERQLALKRARYSEEDQEKFRETEEKFKKQEMAEQKKVRDELKLNVYEFDKKVTELKEANDEIEYVEKLQIQSTERDSGKITDEDAKKRLQIANEKRTKVLAEISILNPELLMDEKAKKQQMDVAERTVVGSQNLKKQDEVSKEVEGNINYAKSTDAKTGAKLELNNDYYQKELQKSRENYEMQLERLKIELKELPENPVTADDMSKKANILAQMKQVKEQIELGDDLEKSMQYNMEKDTDEVDKFVSAGKEYNQDMDKTEEGFEETDEYVKMVEEQEGEKSLENPENTREEDKQEVVEDEVLTAGMAGYAMAEEGYEIPVAVGCACIAGSLVRNVNDPEEAKAYLAVADKSPEQREREKAQQKLKNAEKEVQQ